MKSSIFFAILSMNIFICSIEGQSQSWVSEIYSLDGDFNSILTSDYVEVVLTYTNSQPRVTIETEQWIHTGRYITVTTKPNNGLEIKLTANINYPQIKAYVNYRTPLVAIQMTGTSSVTSTNTIVSNPSSSFSIEHSGSGKAVLELDHRSIIYVAVSGTGQIKLTGQVHGNGQLSVSGSAELDAMECRMRDIQLAVTGYGKAYVYGQGIHVAASGYAVVCYRGTLLTQQVTSTVTLGVCQYTPTSTRSTQSTRYPEEPSRYPEEPSHYPEESTRHPEESSTGVTMMKQSQQILMVCSIAILLFTN